MKLLISVPGASLSAGKNYEKAQVPAFSKTEFFLGRQVSLLVALLLRGLTLAADEATEKVVIFEKCCFLGGQKCLLTSLSSLRSESGASFFKHPFLFLKSWTFSVASR
jgi:hypothetical protein